MRLNSSFKKIIGGITFLCFFWQTAVAYSLPALSGFPKNIAKIQSDSTKPGSKTVLFVLNAHTSSDAQKHIAELLQFFQSQGIDLIGLEGADDKIDGKMFRDFPYKDSLARAAWQMVKEGNFTGAEYFYITAKKLPQFYGLEDRTLYLENRDAFVQTSSTAENLKGTVDSLNGAMTGLKKKIYSKRLLEFDQKVHQYQEGNLSYLDYLANVIDAAKHANISLPDFSNMYALSKAIDKEKKISVKGLHKDLDAMRSSLQKEDIDEAIFSLVKGEKSVTQSSDDILETYKTIHSYFSSLIEQKKLDPKKWSNFSRYFDWLTAFVSFNSSELFEELNKITQIVYDRLGKSENEKTLIRFAGQLDIFQKMLSIQMTQKDWEGLNETNRFQIEEFLLFANRELKKESLEITPEQIELIRRVESSAEHFYQLAEKRNQVFAEKIVKAMDQARKDISVIVIGGFHEKGLKRILEEKGISTAVISPKIEGAPSDIPYFERMIGKPTQFESILKQAVSTLEVALNIAGLALPEERNAVARGLFVRAAAIEAIQTGRVDEVNRTLRDFQVSVVNGENGDDSFLVLALNKKTGRVISIEVQRTPADNFEFAEAGLQAPPAASGRAELRIQPTENNEAIAKASRWLLPTIVVGLAAAVTGIISSNTNSASQSRSVAVSQAPAPLLQVDINRFKISHFPKETQVFIPFLQAPSLVLNEGDTIVLTFDVTKSHLPDKVTVTFEGKVTQEAPVDQSNGKAEFTVPANAPKPIFAVFHYGSDHKQVKPTYIPLVSVEPKSRAELRFEVITQLSTLALSARAWVFWAGAGFYGSIFLLMGLPSIIRHTFYRRELKAMEARLRVEDIPNFEYKKEAYVIQTTVDWTHDVPLSTFRKVRRLLKDKQEFEAVFRPYVGLRKYDSVDPAGSAVAGVEEVGVDTVQERSFTIVLRAELRKKIDSAVEKVAQTIVAQLAQQPATDRMISVARPFSGVDETDIRRQVNTEFSKRLRELARQNRGLNGKQKDALSSRLEELLKWIPDVAPPAKPGQSNFLIVPVNRAELRAKTYSDEQVYRNGIEVVDEFIGRYLHTAPVTLSEESQDRAPLERAIGILITDAAERQKGEAVQVFRRLRRELNSQVSRATLESVQSALSTFQSRAELRNAEEVKAVIVYRTIQGSKSPELPLAKLEELNEIGQIRAFAVRQLTQAFSQVSKENEKSLALQILKTAFPASPENIFVSQLGATADIPRFALETVVIAEGLIVPALRQTDRQIEVAKKFVSKILAAAFPISIEVEGRQSIAISRVEELAETLKSFGIKTIQVVGNEVQFPAPTKENQQAVKRVAFPALASSDLILIRQAIFEALKVPAKNAQQPIVATARSPLEVVLESGQPKPFEKLVLFESRQLFAALGKVQGLVEAFQANVTEELPADIEAAKKVVPTVEAAKSFDEANVIRAFNQTIEAVESAVKDRTIPVIPEIPVSEFAKETFLRVGVAAEVFLPGEKAGRLVPILSREQFAQALGKIINVNAPTEVTVTLVIGRNKFEPTLFQIPLGNLPNVDVETLTKAVIGQAQPLKSSALEPLIKTYGLVPLLHSIQFGQRAELRTIDFDLLNKRIEVARIAAIQLKLTDLAAQLDQKTVAEQVRYQKGAAKAEKLTAILEEALPKIVGALRTQFNQNQFEGALSLNAILVAIKTRASVQSEDILKKQANRITKEDLERAISKDILRYLSPSSAEPVAERTRPTLTQEDFVGTSPEFQAAFRTLYPLLFVAQTSATPEEFQRLAKAAGEQLTQLRAVQQPQNPQAVLEKSHELALLQLQQAAHLIAAELGKNPDVKAVIQNETFIRLIQSILTQAFFNSTKEQEHNALGVLARIVDRKGNAKLVVQVLAGKYQQAAQALTTPYRQVPLSEVARIAGQTLEEVNRQLTQVWEGQSSLELKSAIGNEVQHRLQSILAQVAALAFNPETSATNLRSLTNIAERLGAINQILTKALVNETSTSARLNVQAAQTAIDQVIKSIQPPPAVAVPSEITQAALRSAIEKTTEVNSLLNEALQKIEEPAFKDTVSGAILPQLASVVSRLIALSTSAQISEEELRLVAAQIQALGQQVAAIPAPAQIAGSSLTTQTFFLQQIQFDLEDAAQPLQALFTLSRSASTLSLLEGIENRETLANRLSQARIAGISKNGIQTVGQVIALVNQPEEFTKVFPEIGNRILILAAVLARAIPGATDLIEENIPVAALQRSPSERARNIALSLLTANPVPFNRAVPTLPARQRVLFILAAVIPQAIPLELTLALIGISPEAVQAASQGIVTPQPASLQNPGSQNISIPAAFAQAVNNPEAVTRFFIAIVQSGQFNLSAIQTLPALQLIGLPGNVLTALQTAGVTTIPAFINLITTQPTRFNEIVPVESRLEVISTLLRVLPLTPVQTPEPIFTSPTQLARILAVFIPSVFGQISQPEQARVLARQILAQFGLTAGPEVRQQLAGLNQQAIGAFVLGQVTPVIGQQTVVVSLPQIERAITVIPNAILLPEQAIPIFSSLIPALFTPEQTPKQAQTLAQNILTQFGVTNPEILARIQAEQAPETIARIVFAQIAPAVEESPVITSFNRLANIVEPLVPRSELRNVLQQPITVLPERLGVTPDVIGVLQANRFVDIQSLVTVLANPVELKNLSPSVQKTVNEILAENIIPRIEALLTVAQSPTNPEYLNYILQVSPEVKQLLASPNPFLLERLLSIVKQPEGLNELNPERRFDLIATLFSAALTFVSPQEVGVEQPIVPRAELRNILQQPMAILQEEPLRVSPDVVQVLQKNGFVNIQTLVTVLADFQELRRAPETGAVLRRILFSNVIPNVEKLVEIHKTTLSALLLTSIPSIPAEIVQLLATQKITSLPQVLALVNQPQELIQLNPEVVRAVISTLFTVALTPAVPFQSPVSLETPTVPQQRAELRTGLERSTSILSPFHLPQNQLTEITSLIAESRLSTIEKRAGLALRFLEVPGIAPPNSIVSLRIFLQRLAALNEKIDLPGPSLEFINQPFPGTISPIELNEIEKQFVRSSIIKQPRAELRLLPSLVQNLLEPATRITEPVNPSNPRETPTQPSEITPRPFTPVNGNNENISLTTPQTPGLGNRPDEILKPENTESALTSEAVNIGENLAVQKGRIPGFPDNKLREPLIISSENEGVPVSGITTEEQAIAEMQTKISTQLKPTAIITRYSEDVLNAIMPRLETIDASNVDALNPSDRKIVQSIDALVSLAKLGVAVELVVPSDQKARFFNVLINGYFVHNHIKLPADKMIRIETYGSKSAVESAIQEAQRRVGGQVYYLTDIAEIDPLLQSRQVSQAIFIPTDKFVGAIKGTNVGFPEITSLAVAILSDLQTGFKPDGRIYIAYQSMIDQLVGDLVLFKKTVDHILAQA